MVKEVSQKKTNFTLYDYYEVIIKYKKYIFSITLSVFLVTVVLYFFIIDPVYLSTTTVKSMSKSGGLAGMLSASGLSGLGDVSDLAGGGTGATELALYDNILNSRRCLEETIIKFGLMEENNDKYMQDAIKNFRENILEISKDKTAGTMLIGVFDKNPQRAKDIVDFLVLQLNKINTEISVQNAKNNREFLEGRFNQIKANLKQAEDSLKTYQDKYGLAPDVTVKAALQTELQLEGSVKSEEIKLELLHKILSPDQNEIILQEARINAMKKKLDEIKNSGDEETTLKLKGSPGIVMNFMRLARDVEIQNKIMIFILPIFEQAKIDEKKETPMILVMDQPFVPERKTKPKRITMIFLFTIAGFVLSYSLFFAKDKIKELFEEHK
ncbi:MAG: Wzz/FepE/Etk N-terminal domain-containing protein [Ignavibacteriae bacterium]|nr:Wzz/FepE/Etk N-terminal domain-containing protein [Ignavibacteriota bacterium]